MKFMERLDDRTGGKRDIVQFVHFDSHKHDQGSLTRELLKEIPDQLIQFYKSQGIVPN